MIDSLFDFTVFAVNLQVPIPSVGEQRIVCYGDEQMARALGVDDLGRHRREVHLRDVVVAARQKNVCHALAELVLL